MSKKDVFKPFKDIFLDAISSLVDRRDNTAISDLLNTVPRNTYS